MQSVSVTRWSGRNRWRPCCGDLHSQACKVNFRLILQGVTNLCRCPQLLLPNDLHTPSVSAVTILVKTHMQAGRPELPAGMFDSTESLMLNAQCQTTEITTRFLLNNKQVLELRILLRLPGERQQCCLRKRQESSDGGPAERMLSASATQ